MRHTRSSRRIATIDFSNIGLGDCVAGVATLFHLSRTGVERLSEGCTVLVPTAMLGLARHLLEPRGLRVATAAATGETARHGRTLIPRPPRTVPELVRQQLGRAIYLNWAEGFRLAVSWGANRRPEGAARRLRLKYTEFFQFKTTDFRVSAPLYVGLRMLFPLLTSGGWTVAAHVLKMRDSYLELRAEALRYCETLRGSRRGAASGGGRIVVFPAAASFNAMPIGVCRALEERFGDQVIFAFHENEPLLDGARRSLARIVAIGSVEETLTLLRDNFAVCVDSFPSHLAQMITDDALIVYTRELRERFTHPGARVRVLEAYPACAPCPYRSRKDYDSCPAGHDHCIGFDALGSRLESELARLLEAGRNGIEAANRAGCELP